MHKFFVCNTRMLSSRFRFDLIFHMCSRSFVPSSTFPLPRYSRWIGYIPRLAAQFGIWPYLNPHIQSPNSPYQRIARSLSRGSNRWMSHAATLLTRRSGIRNCSFLHLNSSQLLHRTYSALQHLSSPTVSLTIPALTPNPAPPPRSSSLALPYLLH